MLNDEIGYVLEMGMALILTSLLIGAVFVYGRIGQEVQASMLRDRGRVEEMRQYRELGKYISLSENNEEISGDDIVYFMMSQRRVCDVEIEKKGVVTKIGKGEVEEKKWSREYIEEVLGNTLTERYIIKYTRYEGYDKELNKDLINLIRFEYIGL